MTRTAELNPFRILQIGVLSILIVSEPAVAHGGALGGTRENVAVPIWLVLLTGGGIIGISFLLSSFITNRSLINEIHEAHVALSLPAGVMTTTGRFLGIVGFIAVIYFGLIGPKSKTNPAILLIWVGWWAGYIATVYLIGNSWPAINPLRTISKWIPTQNYSYPSWAGAWPSILGLLLLVWAELTTPVVNRPRLLVVLIGVYTSVTVLGVIVFGSEAWFARVDPVARLCHYYGAIGPIERTQNSIRLRFPGAILRHTRVRGHSEISFIIAMLWITTFDGLVHTPLWNTAVRVLTGWGLPPISVYIGGLVTGFAMFWGGYQLAIQRARVHANSHLSHPVLAERFVVSLLPIAAGYHLAHFLGYFLTWTPTLFTAILPPFHPELTPVILTLPAWFGGMKLLFILGGHLLAIWVAHSIAFELFPGRLQAIRSQYAIVAVMILYTMTSLWIVVQPYVTPLYLGP